MTDTIRIPIMVSDGNFRWHCYWELTPDIARQIVAVAGIRDRIDAICEGITDVAKRVEIIVNNMEGRS